jgi:hypothetical protein
MCSGKEGRAAVRSPCPLVAVNPIDLAGEFDGGHRVVEVPVQVPERFPRGLCGLIVGLEVRP